MPAPREMYRGTARNRLKPHDPHSDWRGFGARTGKLVEGLSSQAIPSSPSLYRVGARPWPGHSTGLGDSPAHVLWHSYALGDLARGQRVVFAEKDEFSQTILLPPFSGSHSHVGAGSERHICSAAPVSARTARSSTLAKFLRFGPILHAWPQAVCC
jgi:hypothetical protein